VSTGCAWRSRTASAIPLRDGFDYIVEPRNWPEYWPGLIRMREEAFGPTLPVMKVKDVEEAIRFANDSSYGLSASVWTRDRAHGEQIARRLETGAVNVNDMFVNTFAIRIPQGGWKESGVGARLDDAHGIRKYCRPQAVTATRLAPRSELLWYPYTAFKGKLFRRVTRFLFARDWGRRLGRRRR
jgi:hypothetical protein